VCPYLFSARDICLPPPARYERGECWVGLLSGALPSPPSDGGEGREFGRLMTPAAPTVRWDTSPGQARARGRRPGGQAPHRVRPIGALGTFGGHELRFGSNGLCQRQQWPVIGGRAVGQSAVEEVRLYIQEQETIIGRRRSKKSFARFWRDTRSSRMSATSGIEAASRPREGKASGRRRPWPQPE
jgi:hypothetical protein